MWERAYCPSQVSGEIRLNAADFYVEEILSFIPDGHGEHVFLYLEKKGVNTQWLARYLAEFAKVKPMDVGYAGMKDRHAVTRQWFSIYLPGKAEPDWVALENDTLQVLQSTRHLKKLRIGSLRGNRFRINVCCLKGDMDFLAERLERIRKEGVPNYFGEQRFGFDQQNVAAARRMFAAKKPPKRTLCSLYLSATRSYLFNEVLSARLGAGIWNRVQTGDWLMLEGSHSIFPAVDEDEHVLIQRLAMGDVHITGPLFGSGHECVEGFTGEFERKIAAQHTDLIEGLQRFGLQHQRRALRVIPAELCWRQSNMHVLELVFELPAGAYATCVLREIVNYQEVLP